MEYYYFAGGNHTEEGRVDFLKNYGFSGVLFTYAPIAADYFTLVANTIKKEEKFKFLIAIRPYLISPQYLRMISQSFDIISKNRVQINLISGHIKEHEKDFGGIVGDTNDHSTSVERSNYLIEFLKETNKMKITNKNLHMADIFVTTTNEYVFQTTLELNYKMIIPYKVYKENRWDIYVKEENRNYNNIVERINSNANKIMLTIYPIIRETKEELISASNACPDKNAELYTYTELYELIKKLKANGIGYLMFGEVIGEEDNVMKFMKWLKENEKKWTSTLL